MKGRDLSSIPPSPPPPHCALLQGGFKMFRPFHQNAFVCVKFLFFRSKDAKKKKVISDF
jgi:hypothetical protein